MKDVHILVLRPMAGEAGRHLSETFTVHDAAARPDALTSLDQTGADIRGLVPGGMRVDAALLERLPNLEIIAAEGIEGIDLEAAARQDIVVTTASDATDETADRAVGLLLAAVRQLPQVDRYLRRGAWLEKPYALTATLRDRKIGILGLGEIGLAIGRRLEAFGVEVSGYDQAGRGSPFRSEGSARSLATAVDVLVVTDDADEKSVVGAEVLSALGPTGIVVSVGGGSALDMQALIEALASKAILTAGLEITDAPKALTGMDHVVLFPRSDAANRAVLDNLESWFSGRGPVSPAAATPFKGTAVA